MELVVLALRDGALVPLLDLEDMLMGDVVATRGGALETRGPARTFVLRSRSKQTASDHRG